jgi:glycosyltransferase involved in cell wall biosynthesis
MADDVNFDRSVRSDRPRVGILYPLEFGDSGIVGGGERYAEELARALSRRIPTRLVTFGSTPRRFRDGDLERVVCRARHRIHGHPLNPLSVSFLRWLANRDVVHCTSWNTLVTDLAILFCVALRKRVYVTDIGGGTGFSLSRRLGLLKRLDGLLLIAEAGGHGFEAIRDRWSIVGAGIDVERYEPAPLAGREGVLFVGRLLPHKGIDTLVRAVRPEWQLTLIGRPYHEAYFELLRELAAGKQVRFVTDATDEQVRMAQRAARVVVLPSVERTVYGAEFRLPELLGFAAMEGLASATPVIVTRVGGLPELVRDEVDGLIVPPSDPDALRRALERLIGDDALAARLGAAGRLRIEEQFTWDAVAARCVAAYRGDAEARSREEGRN